MDVNWARISTMSLQIVAMVFKSWFIYLGMDQHQAHLKSNYHKLADRNYRSGGSGSTSGGGASMDKMQYNKAQFYPKKKLNVSDMTEQENLMHEDKESVFYSAQV